MGTLSLLGGWADKLFQVTPGGVSTVISSFASGTNPSGVAVVPGAPTPTPTAVPVGGIAELPDVSDSSGLSYIALAGLAAAALLALTAGAWYARRRWLS